MKNKEITILDLFKLIADNKAPKKIKIYDDIFELSVVHYYLNGILERENDLFYKISGGYATLNDTVEILSEENDEWEDIELLMCLDTRETTDCICKIQDKINQLIKNQKYLKEKLDNYDRED